MTVFHWQYMCPHTLRKKKIYIYMISPRRLVYTILVVDRARFFLYNLLPLFIRLLLLLVPVFVFIIPHILSCFEKTGNKIMNTNKKRRQQ